MANQIFITDSEREKCQKVADGFVELYEQIDIMIKDAGRYGFVKLYCYEPYYGFHKMTTFTNSRDLFDDLWEEWWHEQVFILALGTPLIDLEYPDIFDALPKEKREKIMSKKIRFEEKCGLKKDLSDSCI